MLLGWYFLSDVYVGGNLNVTGDINLTGSFTGASVTFSGNLTAAGATLGNVTVGLADNQTVTTSSGKLILDAATNEVEINADIDHNGNLNTSGTGHLVVIYLSQDQEHLLVM